MPIEGFYYTYGNDTDMIEKKWFPDVEKRYPNATWLRYDLTIDQIDVKKLVTDYYTNDLFSQGTVIVIRNADKRGAELEGLIAELVNAPVSENALVLVAGGLNKTTKLGKLVKKYFITKEFSSPEIKPFDLLDNLNMKKTSKVLYLSNRLFESDYHALALFSLVFNHLLLLRKVKEMETGSVESIAKELKQHPFRIKKIMVGCRFWAKEEIEQSLKFMERLDGLIRTWQYNEKMLVQMALIKMCLEEQYE